MNYPNYQFHGIMFHHFHDKKIHKAGQGSISSDELFKIINFIGRDNILNPDDFYELLISNKLKNNQYCLTFDDGIKCQIDIALPLLEELKLKAFFFIYSSIFTGKPDYLEVYRYFRINFFESIDNFYDYFFSFVKGNLENFFLKNQDEIKKWKRFYPFYSENDIKFRFIRDRFLTKKEYFNINLEIFDKMNFIPENFFKILFIDKKTLRQLDKSGHTIGLHSHNHPTLIENLNVKEQEDEYKDNLTFLNKLLNYSSKKIYSASHPLGSYNKSTLEILDNLNIKLAFRDNMFIDKEKGMKSINNSNLEISRQDHTNILKLIH